MKIYTQEIDIALQSPKRFWVAPFSDFKIGVKIVKNGTPVDNEFAVFNGDTELTPDEDLVNGFTTFTLKSNDTGSVEYKVVVAGVGETFKITQIVTDSTVFEVGGSGGGDVPADVATKTWVQNYVSAETSEFVDGNDVDQAISAATSTFVTSSDVDTAISAATSEFVTTSEVEATVSTAVEAATSEFVTASDVDTAISAATSTFVNSTQVSEAISAATSTFVTASDVVDAISAATSEFATTSAVVAAISTATTDMATQTWVGQQGYVSQNDLSLYATTSAMESYVDAQIGAVLSMNF